jgi:hypothetical protein
MPYLLTEEVRDSLVIRMQYDASSSWNNMFSYSGTAIESVFSNPLWWALTGLHWMLWFLKEFHTCQEGTAPLTCIPAKQVFDRYPLSLSDIGMMTSLVTFFLVFYNGNCFSRYQAMYEAAIAIQGKMHNVSMYLRAYYTMPATRWNVIRYLLASHYIFYWSIRRRYYDWKNTQYKYADPGSFADLCEDVLISNGVLIKMEAEALQGYKGNKHK